MKFIHLSDLHFGKIVHNISMTEYDQPYFVNRLIEKIDEIKPDAIIVAGDIYDRKAPSTDAIELFDRFVTEISEKNVPLIISPGNHDSDIRLSQFSNLLSHHNITVTGKLTEKLRNVKIGNVMFWLLPYCYPTSIRGVIDGDFNTYEEAISALLDKQDINENEINVLLAHQNVVDGDKKPESSQSESSVIGGTGAVQYTVFDRFDYVALGHIHNAQSIGRDTVRYSGCPLYYDFSEVGRDKSLTVVEITNKNDIKITREPISLLHGMEIVKGTVDEICKAAENYKDRKDVYVKAVITDEKMPALANDKIHAAFGNSNILLDIELDRTNKKSHVSSGSTLSSEAVKSMSLDEQFSSFCKYVTGNFADADMNELIKWIAQEQEKSGYYSDVGKVTDEDKEKMVEMIRKIISSKEDNR